MLNQVVYYLLLVGLLTSTSRASFQTRWFADNNVFEPLYTYDEADIIPNPAHRSETSFRSPFEGLSELMTSQKPLETVAISTPPLVLDKSPVRVESNNSVVVSNDEVKSQRYERKKLKDHEGRHLSGLENYYQKLRKSLDQNIKYDFLANELSGNMLQQRDEKQGRLASLVLNGRWVRSKEDENKQRETNFAKHREDSQASVALVELRPTPDKTLEEVSKNWSNSSIIEYDTRGQHDVEFMHRSHVLFVENRKQEQMEMFDDELDLSEVLQQEADVMPCGPRNYVKTRGKLAGEVQDFGEFPSHVGLYTTTNTTDNLNFLCGATWIHEQFVLTLASCLNEVELNQLVVRLGEWNLGKQAESMTTMLTSRVDKLFRFPHYFANDSTPSHNLALLRLAAPSSQLDYRRRLTYLTPACLPNSRAMLQTLNCRAPGRRTAISEYLDLDGDGEIKMQQSVEMVEQSVEIKCSVSQFVKEYIAPSLICLKRSEPQDHIQYSPKVDLTGSGVYCNKSGVLSLMSMVQQDYNQTILIDLTFYRPWLRNITLGNN